MNHMLLNMLACPNCHGTLIGKNNSLICEKEQLVYPIVNGIAVLLPESGKAIQPEELTQS